MTINDAQQKIDVWIKEYGVRYFNELTNTIILSEEVGEFSSLIARLYGEQSFKTVQKRNSAKEDVKEEMADILFVLICLANQMGINLDEALAQNLEKKTNRDNTRHHNNPKLK